MASISVYSYTEDDAVSVVFDGRYGVDGRCVRVEFGPCDALCGITVAEAVKARDGLSAAILEAAAAAAKAKAEEAA